MLAPVIETSQHVKKKGKEGLKLGDEGSVMRQSGGKQEGVVKQWRAHCATWGHAVLQKR